MTAKPSHDDLHPRVDALAARLCARGERLAVAESCTGGLLAKLATDRPGSSAWFDCGLVTYSNAAKQSWLGVPAALIEGEGAVSAAAVLAMLAGLLQRAPVDWAIAVSGIAGPDGGSADKPVGTVWIGWSGRAIAPSASRFQFGGDRDAVRRQSAAAAFDGLLALLHAEAA